MVASEDYWRRGGGGSATGQPQQGWEQTAYRKNPGGSPTEVKFGYYPNPGSGTTPPMGGGWPGQGGGGQPGQQPGGGFQNPGGGGWYGNPGDGGTQIPSTNPPAQNPANNPLFTKGDTDRAVSQAAANAFSQGDPYSLKVASAGNGLSFGAGQQSQIHPLIAQAGTTARSAAKTIPIQDAFANQQWLLGNQTNQAQDALDWARLGEYRYQTDQMGSDYFQKLLTALLGGL